jgi:transcriptional regulator with XRE-family HTH domain
MNTMPTGLSGASFQSLGNLLRMWRQRRRMSQLDLACEADISTRHLSFLETGRSVPSREMVLHLAEQLEIPLRERNALLIAAGYAPLFPERPLEDAALQAARKAVELVLAGHEPFPAMAIDRHWTLVKFNRAVAHFLELVNPSLLEPPVNVLRLSLHPEGFAPHIANLGEWRAHLFERLRRQIEITADSFLSQLFMSWPAILHPKKTTLRPRPTRTITPVSPSRCGSFRRAARSLLSARRPFLARRLILPCRN